MREMDTIREAYQRRERDEEWQRRYNTVFCGETADYRAQQLLFFSNALRITGRPAIDQLRLLEIGCGSGNIMRLLFAMGVAAERMHGIDIRSTETLRRRRWRILLGCVLNRLAWPVTHTGAVIGPKS